MPVKDLYYNKYVKYKNKYLYLQSQIGGSPPELIPKSGPTPEPIQQSTPEPPPLVRQPSVYISCQGLEGTCWAHATTRLFIKLMLTFLSKKLSKFLNKLSKIDCNHYYDTIKCSDNETNIFDCFLQIKEGRIKCDSSEGNQKDIGWSEEQHLYALLFHFIFLTLVEQFGRGEMGSYSQTACLYILDYLKYIDIDKNLIITRLSYKSTKYSSDEDKNHFDKLINDLNEFFNIIKNNLNNKFFDPIMYIYKNSLTHVVSLYDYHYRSKNFECNANDFNIIDTQRLSFKEKYEKKNPFSSKIENLNPKYTIEHNLRKFTKTTNLLENIKHVLDKDKPYYVLFITKNHVVIITHYSVKGKDTFLHVRNSWGIQSCKKTEAWCNLIKDDQISIESLNKYTNPYSIIFFYPYTFTKEQNDIIETMNDSTNTQLIFRKDEINNDEIKAIVYGLIRTTVLIELILSEYNIGDIEAIAIADALVINRTLKKLNLRQNRIGERGANAIANALKINNILEVLLLGENEIGNTGADAIAKKLGENKTLKTLILDENKIGDEGAKAIAVALKQNNNLQTLILGKNDIGDIGAEAISDALTKNIKLKTLSLIENKFNENGAVLIGNSFRYNTNLEILTLSNNIFGDIGTKAIAEGLKKNKKLLTLVLDNTRIGDIGAKAIAEALKTNETLTKLMLSHNNIGDDGATAIVEALKINQILENIYLDNNILISSETKRTEDIRLIF
jgi:Ran GTPase-activating protein (RanGAP) involved in mRNA processing and transport